MLTLLRASSNPTDCLDIVIGESKLVTLDCDSSIFKLQTQSWRDAPLVLIIIGVLDEFE